MVAQEKESSLFDLIINPLFSFVVIIGKRGTWPISSHHVTEQAWSIRNDYYLIIKFKHGAEDNKTAEKNEVNI